MDRPRAVQALFQVWTTYPLSAGTPGGGSVSVSPAPYAGQSLPQRYGRHAYGDAFQRVVVHSLDRRQHRHHQRHDGRDGSAPHRAGGIRHLINPVYEWERPGAADPPTGPYPFGSTVQLTALPSPGYYFFGWSGAASGFANPLLFTVTNASGITALFGALKTNQVSLTVLPNGNGTVAIDPASNVYTNGDTVTLTASPATDYAFIGWSGDASGASNPLVLLLDTNKLITANFALHRHRCSKRWRKTPAASPLPGAR